MCTVGRERGAGYPFLARGRSAALWPSCAVRGDGAPRRALPWVIGERGGSAQEVDAVGWVLSRRARNRREHARNGNTSSSEDDDWILGLDPSLFEGGESEAESEVGAGSGEEGESCSPFLDDGGGGERGGGVCVSGDMRDVMLLESHVCRGGTPAREDGRCGAVQGREGGRRRATVDSLRRPWRWRRRDRRGGGWYFDFDLEGGGRFEDWFEVRQSAILAACAERGAHVEGGQGWGLFARRRFPQGAALGTYEGVDLGEVDSWEADAAS